MNETERKALVDELADGLRDKLGPWDSLEFETWEGIAGACLPIIERLLAGERQRIRDKLLDPVMFNESFISQLATILDFVGITEEGARGLE